MPRKKRVSKTTSSSGRGKKSGTRRSPRSETVSSRRLDASQDDASEDDGAESVVTLQTAAGPVCQVPMGRDMQNLALRWNYIIRNRKRWTRRRDSREDVAQRATEALGSLGIKDSDLRKLSESGIAEVKIPFRSEKQGWEARIFPWEFMLSAATEAFRGEQFLAITRYLECERTSEPRVPASLLVAEAAPGTLREEFDFDAESDLVRASLRLADSDPLQDPTATAFEQQVRLARPDIIHLTGVDTHLGEQLLGTRHELSLNDGILLSGPRNEVVPVGAERLAAILTSADPPPVFIGFNCWNSGARLAPLAVAAGANAALGFQHTFDDSIAELFFVNFYRGYAENDWDLLSAFLQAFEAIQSYNERIQGSIIVLWSDRSLLSSTTRDVSKREEAQTQLRSRRERLKSQTRPADPSRDCITDLVDVSVVPLQHLNYSLLHNNRSVLKNLTFRFKPQAKAVSDEGELRVEDDLPVGSVKDIEVTVVLSSAAETFPFRTTVAINSVEAVRDLADDEEGGVRVPLTSELARSVDERVQTSLYVDIRWHGQLLYQHTHSVFLMPVDEWKLTQEDICWLPSFVQPRDPAIAEIIASAQRYLRCLADYSYAGFDGYQSYDETATDAWEGVQRQVRAIWSAIVFDYQLDYINPPPVYSLTSQRLRTPLQTIQQGRGTCIDLALLFASCLEWIEVYPVVFLLDGHAFPGYWKSLDAYEGFCQVRQADDSEASLPEVDSTRSTSATLSAPWIADRNSYRELKQLVDNGELVPIETVCLTDSTGFQDAIGTALEHFAKARNRSFHSMVDVAMARAEQITPLPICLPRHPVPRD